HGDLTFPDHIHIPLASLSKEIADNTVTCMSPSKTFNLAALQASYIITPNKSVKDKIDETLQAQGLGMLNTMENSALDAAYKYRQKWLDTFLSVIQEKYTYVRDTIHNQTSKLRVRH